MSRRPRDPARFVPWTIAAAVAALLGFALWPRGAGREPIQLAPTRAEPLGGGVASFEPSPSGDGR